KYSGSGSNTPVWVKCFGGTSDEFAYGVAVDKSSDPTRSGDIALTGTYGSSTLDFGAATGPISNSSGGNIFVAKFSASGACRWAKGFEGNLGYGDVGHAVAVDGSGNVAITGNLIGAVSFGGAMTFSNGTYDIFIAKFLVDGTYAWSKRIGL